MPSHDTKLPLAGQIDGPSATAMRLRLSTPDQQVVDALAWKISAEGIQGAFTLLPRHLDLVTALRPGILSYVDHDGKERLLAVNEGILVKAGSTVSVACLAAVTGQPLGELEATIQRRFVVLEERERVARTAFARLEADFVRQMMRL